MGYLKEKKFLIFLFLLILSLLNFPKLSVFAQTETPTTTPTPTPSVDFQQKQKEINDLQNKVSDLQKQSKTLSSQIDVIDSQIKLTELKISATKEEIDGLTKDIGTASKKITDLEESLNQITKALLNRMVATYEVGTVQPFQVLIASNNVDDFFSRLNYLKMVQEHDKKLIYDTQQTKTDYANQKEIFEEKKQKVEALKKQLEGYTNQIAQEKKEKENLLTVTKNSESEYQARLAEALKELNQIQGAAKVLVMTESRHVNKGDPIGIMGNSGYSFGAHLHFGVYDISSLTQYNYYSNFESPANVLQSQSVDWETECPGDPVGSTNTGSGSFSWPMSLNGLHITQGFGHTCYSDVYYRGNPHPAFDMYNNDDKTVRAVEEGEAYVCRNCTGDGGNGVFIFHPNGKMTLYWHLQ